MGRVSTGLYCSTPPLHPSLRLELGWKKNPPNPPGWLAQGHYRVLGWRDTRGWRYHEPGRTNTVRSSWGYAVTASCSNVYQEYRGGIGGTKTRIIYPGFGHPGPQPPGLLRDQGNAVTLAPVFVSGSESGKIVKRRKRLEEYDLEIYHN